MILGYLEIEKFLEKTKGLVSGSVITDAKDRQYYQQYKYKVDGSDIEIQRADGNGDVVRLPRRIALDESLIAFFGLYSGDGAKGSEDGNGSTRIIPTISFSQKEKHLVRFAVDQFKKIFPNQLRFTFSLGEDSAYFMKGEGENKLRSFYEQNKISFPAELPLSSTRPSLNDKDGQYLKEIRPDILKTNEEYLSFYYQHKDVMQEILTAEKAFELASVGILKDPQVSITASLRRPFKKGAREEGGSSRSDEIHVGGLNGIGELFLKMMHEVENTTLVDSQNSSSGLVVWNDIPSKIGQVIDLHEFFQKNPYGIINGARPVELTLSSGLIEGKWRQSSPIKLKRNLIIDPLWCYISGLYLAEGSTPKDSMFKMFSTSPGSLSFGFTSSEGISLELVLRTLRKIFQDEDCLEAWKVKVGSQYFPELVMTGLKQGVPMLRGGDSGEGKLRTMEISLPIKEWALNVADTPLQGKKSLLRELYADKFSHVEPTGAGVARIDFWASSTISRWFFPLLMFTVFGGIVEDPSQEFYKK